MLAAKIISRRYDSFETLCLLASDSISSKAGFNCIVLVFAHGLSHNRFLGTGSNVAGRFVDADVAGRFVEADAVGCLVEADAVGLLQVSLTSKDIYLFTQLSLALSLDLMTSPSNLPVFTGNPAFLFFSGKKFRLKTHGSGVRFCGGKIRRVKYALDNPRDLSNCACHCNSPTSARPSHFCTNHSFI